MRRSEQGLFHWAGYRPQQPNSNGSPWPRLMQTACEEQCCSRDSLVSFHHKQCHSFPRPGVCGPSHWPSPRTYHLLCGQLAGRQAKDKNGGPMSLSRPLTAACSWVPQHALAAALVCQVRESRERGSCAPSGETRGL